MARETEWCYESTGALVNSNYGDWMVLDHKFATLITFLCAPKDKSGMPALCATFLPGFDADDLVPAESGVGAIVWELRPDDRGLSLC
jgi:hypothetical protein